jgi:FkbM family methyltransferase
MKPRLQERFAKLRDKVSDRYFEFRPHIGSLPIAGCPLRFFYGTRQAADWYDPLRAHNRAEFEWVAAHVGGHREKIIDAGAFHGLYTLVFAKSIDPAGEVVAVDPVPSNCALIEVNLALNGARARIEQCAVSAADGEVRFSADSCGQIVGDGGTVVRGRRLASLLPDATVVKLDIEGAEFGVLPAQIDELPAVHTWIVEIHPAQGRDGRSILRAFTERGFGLWWVDRSRADVEPFDADRPWTTRTSMIALRTRPA